MTLYDILALMASSDAMCAKDAVSEVEIYFRGGERIESRFDELVLEIAKLLKIRKICSEEVVIDMSKLLEDKIDILKEAHLFKHCDVNSIMSEMEDTLTIMGTKSLEWLETFLQILQGKALDEIVVSGEETNSMSKQASDEVKLVASEDVESLVESPDCVSQQLNEE